MFLRKISLQAALLSLLMLSSCGHKEESADASLAGLPKDFTTRPDTTKVRLLLDQGLSLDSLAHYVCLAAVGDKGAVTFSDLSAIGAYLYEVKGESDFEVYTIAFDEYRSHLPLVKKLIITRKGAIEDADRVGYQLGLEYVNDVIDKHLTIGQVDREVADFRRACGDDEDTYNRFLKGFSTGIKTRDAGSISPDIANQYSK